MDDRDDFVGILLQQLLDPFHPDRSAPGKNSSLVTCAPKRSATSAIRLPNTPFSRTSTLSPGSTVLTKAASMPREPVPDIGTVTSWLVCISVRSPAFT